VLCVKEHLCIVIAACILGMKKREVRKELLHFLFQRLQYFICQLVTKFLVPRVLGSKQFNVISMCSGVGGGGVLDSSSAMKETPCCG
jgi:hypothetical protein